MTVVDLTFTCDRLTEHSDGQPRSWTVKGQERVMNPRTQNPTPVVVSTDAVCPECSNTGVADYTAATVYVIPDDESFKEQVDQIREAIAEEAP